jgi:hypothetical protein
MQGTPTSRLAALPVGESNIDRELNSDPIFPVFASKQVQIVSSPNLRQNPPVSEAFAHPKQVIGDACAHPSPTPFAPSSPHSHRFQGSSPVRKARLPQRSSREAELAPPQVPADRRELLTSFKARSASAAPQAPSSSANTANSASSAYSDAVNPVSLYASPTQTQSHHQLPHPNYQVRNDIFSCTIRCEERQTAADDGRGACTSGSITPPQ